MSRKQRQGMIDREHRKVSLARQCTLLDISRAWLYYQPTTPSAEDLELMDRQYLKTPFYGSRKMQAWLQGLGHPAGRNKVRRLMRLMGLEAIYRRPQHQQARARAPCWTLAGPGCITSPQRPVPKTWN